ncbi:hypothetical protein DPMN_080336 [Dreissena polymorpha]|uniref:Uncharacterized protein n=1 Tax=Dreissena polymorpha TaxID=45954 RepID=A0A9D3YW61_DREPO|nr:hypothetical protein DPMN_080336 [Dreissena polymorpha]
MCTLFSKQVIVSIAGRVSTQHLQEVYFLVSSRALRPTRLRDWLLLPNGGGPSPLHRGGKL